MVSTMSAVLITLLALIAGIFIGGLLWRSFGSHQHRNRDLEARLAEAEQKLGDYQTEVTEHFLETSRRVNELTRNYKEVHDYLASSAIKLTKPSLGRDLREAAQLSWPEKEAERGEAQVESETPETAFEPLQSDEEDQSHGATEHRPT